MVHGSPAFGDIVPSDAREQHTLSAASATRLLTAAAAGTIVEWYDFFVFATCAVLVFDKTFFPSNDPYTGILLGLSTYAVGFAARPVGGLIFGSLGDRVGRKSALVASMFLMGSATFAMGLLPDYRMVGPLAPFLLVLLRILQGLAVGGEATGALTLVAESMPAGQRGFWVSFPMIGGPAANMLASSSIIWCRPYSGQMHLSNGLGGFHSWPQPRSCFWASGSDAGSRSPLSSFRSLQRRARQDRFGRRSLTLGQP